MISPEIKNPPTSLFQKLKFLGPGFILSASIVGSGELIATTVLGAEGGFITFWVILVSCLVKVAIQLEFGKNAIVTGKPLMGSFSKLPGPKNWAVWTTFLLTLFKILQLGGMIGGAAIALSMLLPQLSPILLAFILGAVTSLLIYRNYYSIVEKTSMVMVVGFTVFTLASVIAVSYSPYAFTFSDVLSGLAFELPSNLVFVAIGAFGITGVASDEIIAYTYWCLEKGYAKYTGENDGTEEWKNRANGWIKIMYLDAIVAMMIYTVVTAAFYLLGASILYGNADIPSGNQLIETLANIYTQTLGENARLAYISGAFFVLFSSVFATLAYWTRLFPDIFGEFGWIDWQNLKTRKRWVAILAWVLPILWAIAFAFVKLPAFMVLSGGVVGSVLLLLVVYAAIQFRIKNNALNLASGLFSSILFWLSVFSIGLVSIYGIVKLF
ncbi:Mn2+/Fe2+ NRAMP family transporter [Algoriphagus ratkowskyi]|uniref:Divalent metal cation transporter n=1 Tax=Algoriphagus ratkowskyi TaxID=57028 RepID=A0A2W7S1D2_9BACT|nr:Nramp family divalent metal transporter [Algoriphagus ratkowskyi]PZX56945.1 Mn2+/Fe2+ NRAMP family transporter [Algoriphagus ratkowskyi]TXD79856.1 divalent metal cation transporter [Algoriphagus ratkowskyi]